VALLLTVGTVASAVQRLAEGDVMAIGVLDSELPKTVRRVIDRVVDGGSALSKLSVQLLNVVHPNVGVPHLGSTTLREEHVQASGARRGSLRKQAVLRPSTASLPNGVPRVDPISSASYRSDPL
jgi:hypothetical protein